MRFPPFALLLVFAFSPLAAHSAEPDVFTTERLVSLRGVGSVQISPDGSRIAYTVFIPRKPNVDDDGRPWTELHVADTRTGTSRVFVGGEVNVGNVEWTPDGRAITFGAKRGKDENTVLYRIPVDGGEARVVVKHEGADVGAYAWSGDGKRLAYLAQEKKSKDRKDLEKKGFDQRIFEEDDRPTKVWIATIEDGAAEPAAGKALDFLGGSVSAIAWERTGSRIAVALAPTPLVDDEMMETRLHIADVDSKKVVKIGNPGKLGAFAWSPDGKHIAYHAGGDVNDPIPGRLMVVEAEGGVPRDLLPGFLGDVIAVAWKDARTVLHLTREGATTQLAQVGAQGGARKVLVPGGRGKEIVATFDVTPDGKSGALVAHHATHPIELFHWPSTAAAKVARLTRSNPWLEKTKLAKQEVFRWKARDGLALEGILVRPLDEKPGQRYPLIVDVHGGPETAILDGWVTGYADPGQLAAARGFAVFAPNYRASAGRGVEFSKLDHLDPAGKEFDDIIDGVDALIASGLVDKAKVGITGGSYGGYASAWGATYYSDRYAAAVSFVGISDLTSFYGVTDIPNEMILVHWRKFPWDDWAFMLERSPIKHASKSKTPTLILHGTADTRVPPGQSLQLYRHLKQKGKAPVRLVLYPGEGHGNRDAASRLDYSMRMLQWFEHYLKGPGGEPPKHELDYPKPPKKDDEEKKSSS